MGDSRSAHVGSGETKPLSPIQQVAEAIGDDFADVLSLFQIKTRVISMGSVGQEIYHMRCAPMIKDTIGPYAYTIHVTYFQVVLAFLIVKT